MFGTGNLFCTVCCFVSTRIILKIKDHFDLFLIKKCLQVYVILYACTRSCLKCTVLEDSSYHLVSFVFTTYRVKTNKQKDINISVMGLMSHGMVKWTAFIAKKIVMDNLFWPIFIHWLIDTIRIFATCIYRILKS